MEILKKWHFEIELMVCFDGIYFCVQIILKQGFSWQSKFLIGSLLVEVLSFAVIEPFTELHILEFMVSGILCFCFCFFVIEADVLANVG